MGHKTTSFPLKKGDIIRVETPGAGGYGDPMKREPEKVLTDVIEQKVSVEEVYESPKRVLRQIAKIYKFVKNQQPENTETTPIVE